MKSNRWISECQASRLHGVGPVVTWRMQVSSNQPREALQSEQLSFIGIKKRSRKSNKSCKPLLCLRSCLRSSNELRPEPRGESERRWRRL
jgi:hypothetical protein